MAITASDGCVTDQAHNQARPNITKGRFPILLLTEMLEEIVHGKEARNLPYSVRFSLVST